MEEEKFYGNIQKAIEQLKGNINILEERIDIEIQMQYMEFSSQYEKNNVAELSAEISDELFSQKLNKERKKEILCALAKIDDVKAFRIIESYLSSPEPELKEWALLAYQESKMLMQSSLLEEQQVFISTGLGGKGQMLRYFAVFFGREKNEHLNPVQKKLLKKEMDFAVKQHKGELEETSFMKGFTAFQLLLPLTADLQAVFKTVIDECNEIGNFLEEDMVVTNVKILNRNEIIELISKKNTNGPNELERQ